MVCKWCFLLMGSHDKDEIQLPDGDYIHKSHLNHPNGNRKKVTKLFEKHPEFLKKNAALTYGQLLTERRTQIIG